MKSITLICFCNGKGYTDTGIKLKLSKVVTLWRVTIFMKKMEVIVLTHDTKRPNKQYISRIMMITVIFGCWRTSLRGRTFIEVS